MNKKSSERDICTKFITPAILDAGWDRMTQYREEVAFTAAKIIVRDNLVVRSNKERVNNNHAPGV